MSYQRIILLLFFLNFSTSVFANPDNLIIQIINQGNVDQTSGHILRYAIAIPDEETLVNNSHLERNIPPRQVSSNEPEEYSAIVNIARYDHDPITTDLKITDSYFDDKIIWEGKITADPKTNETIATPSKTDEKNYNIHLETNKSDQPDLSLKITVVSKN